MIITTAFSLMLSACIHFQAVFTDYSTPEPHISYEATETTRASEEKTVQPSYCNLCSEQVTDEAYMTLDGVVCGECYEDFYTCARCGEPQTIHATDGYTCQTCNPNGEPCEVCGTWVPSGYYCCHCD